jgi:dethiobiotin synthetase
MLRPITIPGLFITATDTGVGKTVIASAIANWFRVRGKRVGVCKIAATGCVHRPEGLVSEDAEQLAYCADSPFPLDVICPIRFAEPLAPAVAAQRARVPLDWSLLQSSLARIVAASDVMIVEGVGGIMVPMDDQYTVLDVARWLALRTVIVARPGLGTINHTLLTVNALRSANVEVAGVVINRYPTDTLHAAVETNPAEIEKRGRVPLLCPVPDEPFTPPGLPPGLVAAVGRVDWLSVIIGTGEWVFSRNHPPIIDKNN